MKTSYFKAPELAKARASFFAVRASVYPCRWFKPDGNAPSLYPDPSLLGMKGAAYRRRYLAGLDRIGVEAIRAELDGLKKLAGKRELVLLCFESLKEEGQFCHRRIFAEWWEAKTGEVISELSHPAPPPPRRRPSLKQANPL